MIMGSPHPPPRPRARILGPGQSITIQHAATGERSRVHVRSRSGRLLEVEALPGCGITLDWESGTNVELRVARPFGLFRYSAEVISIGEEGTAQLRLDPRPARRQQLREYFRLPVHLSVRLETSGASPEPTIIRAVDLSAGGVRLLDPEERLTSSQVVWLGLPIGPAGEILRITARVVRIEEDPRSVALSFEAIGEGARQVVLRYLFREHRRRTHRKGRGRRAPARITSIHESS